MNNEIALIGRPGGKYLFILSVRAIAEVVQQLTRSRSHRRTRDDV